LQLPQTAATKVNPHSKLLVGQHAFSLRVCWKTVVTITGGITALDPATELPASRTARIICSFQQSPITGPQLTDRYSLPSVSVQPESWQRRHEY